MRKHYLGIMGLLLIAGIFIGAVTNVNIAGVSVNSGFLPIQNNGVSFLSGPYTIVGGGAAVQVTPPPFPPGSVESGAFVLNATAGGATFNLQNYMATPGTTNMDTQVNAVSESHATATASHIFYTNSVAGSVFAGDSYQVAPVGSGLGAGTTLQIFYRFTK